MARERFVELMREAVLMLPQDLKTALRVVEDQDIDEAARTGVAGALLHVLSQGTSIPGVRGVLQHVGSALVLRVTLESAQKESPDAMKSHEEDYPELFGPLEEQLSVAREYLGDGMSVLEATASKVHKLNHQGHSAAQCVTDVESSTWLYDAVHEALVETLEIDEDEVHREIKNVEQIKNNLAARARK